MMFLATVERTTSFTPCHTWNESMQSLLDSEQINLSCTSFIAHMIVTLLMINWIVIIRWFYLPVVFSVFFLLTLTLEISRRFADSWHFFHSILNKFDSLLFLVRKNLRGMEIIPKLQIAVDLQSLAHLRTIHKWNNWTIKLTPYNRI